eukprot:14746-Heterococcus_DN1.PRE.1
MLLSRALTLLLFLYVALTAGERGSHDQQLTASKRKGNKEQSFLLTYTATATTAAALEVNRWRELNAECTFQPRIRPLPQGYGTAANSSSGGNSSAPFLQRVSKWQRDKTAAAAHREQDGDDKHTFYCPEQLAVVM